VRLNFLPIVLGDGRIHMEVEPEVSNLDAGAGTQISGVTVPGRATRRVNSTVVVEPGHTIVLGGLMRKQTAATTRKVPVLGDLPFLGVMFSSKDYNELEEEVLILVTPHLVDPMSCEQAPKCLPGQET